MNLFESSYCLTLSLAAGLKQPYTDSLPLVDGLSPPQQPQRDIQYRAACRVFFFAHYSGARVRCSQVFNRPLRKPAGSRSF